MIWEGAPNSTHHRVFQKELKSVTPWRGGMGKGREIQEGGDMCVCVYTHTHTHTHIYDYDLHRNQHNIAKKIIL